MQCLECKGNEFTFDERLGERVCDACGFVHVEEIFERTVSNYTYENNEPIARQIVSARSRLGSEKPKAIEQRWVKSINYMMALSAEFRPTKQVKDEMAYNYITLVKGHQFRGFTLDERVGALIFFTFRENNRAITLRELAKHCDASAQRVSKLARKIARFFGRPWVLSQVNYQGEFERIGLGFDKCREFIADCIRVHLYLQPICEENNVLINQAYVGAVIYITGILRNEPLTQNEIRDALGNYSVRKRYLDIKKLTKANFTTLTTEEFVSGVYKKCEKY